MGEKYFLFWNDDIATLSSLFPFETGAHRYAEFQLMHAPAAFHADRIAWRAVIYLNLVRSIRRQAHHFALPVSLLISVFVGF